jgi:hypothetical protein
MFLSTEILTCWLTPIHAILAIKAGNFHKYKVPVVLARMANDGVILASAVSSGLSVMRIETRGQIFA